MARPVKVWWAAVRVACLLELFFLLGPLSPALGKIAEDHFTELSIVPLGERAPAFQGRRLDGKSVSLEEFAGKPVILYFWATW